MKLMPIALVVSLSVLAACGDSKPTGGNGLASNGFVEGTPKFEMPASFVYEMVHVKNPEALYGTEFRVREVNDWKSKDWTLWVVSNSYSDAKSTIAGSTGIEDAHNRAIREGNALFETKKALEQNGFHLKYNYLNYSLMPAMTREKAERSLGVGMTFDGAKCGQGFINCVDRYFYSPAARFKAESGQGKTFMEWTKPYTLFTEDGMGKAALYVAKSKGFGSGDGEKAEFYDWWPTMIFLVSPDNEVVRAWLPQAGNDAGWANILRGVAETFGTDLDDIKLEGLQRNPYIQFPAAVYHGSSAEQVAIEQMKKAMQSLQGTAL